jgi:hypothetical protein
MTHHQPLHPGQHVDLAHASGRAVGIITEIAATSDLPQLPRAASALVARRVLEDLGVDRVAIIRYVSRDAGEPPEFAALHVAASDEWRDLHDQVIRIRPRPEL